MNKNEAVYKAVTEISQETYIDRKSILDQYSYPMDGFKLAKRLQFYGKVTDIKLHEIAELGKIDKLVEKYSKGTS